MKRRAGLLAAAIAMATPSVARADSGGGDMIEGIAILVGIPLLIDAGFVAYDTVQTAKNELPGLGGSIPQIVLGVPQAAVGAGLMYAFAAHDGAPTPILPLLASIPTFMSVYGTWGTFTSNADSGALYGVSWATGIDAQWTATDIGHLAHGTRPGITHGILEMLSTGPQIAVSTLQIADQKGSEVGWAVLEGWAGLLFVHGIVSIIQGPADDDDLPPSPVEPSSIPPAPPPKPEESPIAPDPPQGRAPVHGPDASWDIGPVPFLGGAGMAAHGTW